MSPSWISWCHCIAPLFQTKESLLSNNSGNTVRCHKIQDGGAWEMKKKIFLMCNNLFISFVLHTIFLLIWACKKFFFKITSPPLPWVPEVFSRGPMMLRFGGWRPSPRAAEPFMRVKQRLTETRNRVWKASGTQGSPPSPTPSKVK